MPSLISSTHRPRVWIGHSLVAIALVHSIAAVLFFGPVFHGLWNDGLLDSVGRDPMRAAAVWFALFGPVLALLGVAVTRLEQLQEAVTLRLLGIGVLAMCVLGIALMPASGFWLALPPAIALLRKRG